MSLPIFVLPPRPEGADPLSVCQESASKTTTLTAAASNSAEKVQPVAKMKFHFQPPNVPKEIPIAKVTEALPKLITETEIMLWTGLAMQRQTDLLVAKGPANRTRQKKKESQLASQPVSKEPPPQTLPLETTRKVSLPKPQKPHASTPSKRSRPQKKPNVKFTADTLEKAPQKAFTKPPVNTARSELERAIMAFGPTPTEAAAVTDGVPSSQPSKEFVRENLRDVLVARIEKRKQDESVIDLVDSDSDEEEAPCSSTKQARPSDPSEPSTSTQPSHNQSFDHDYIAVPELFRHELDVEGQVANIMAEDLPRSRSVSPQKHATTAAPSSSSTSQTEQIGAATLGPAPDPPSAPSVSVTAGTVTATVSSGDAHVATSSTNLPVFRSPFFASLTPAQRQRFLPPKSKEAAGKKLDKKKEKVKEKEKEKNKELHIIRAKRDYGLLSAKSRQVRLKKYFNRELSLLLEKTKSLLFKNHLPDVEIDEMELALRLKNGKKLSIQQSSQPKSRVRRFLHKASQTIETHPPTININQNEIEDSDSSESPTFGELLYGNQVNNSSRLPQQQEAPKNGTKKADLPIFRSKKVQRWPGQVNKQQVQRKKTGGKQGPPSSEHIATTSQQQRASEENFFEIFV